jgi:hypothetical protein
MKDYPLTTEIGGYLTEKSTNGIVAGALGAIWRGMEAPKDGDIELES